MKFNVYGSMVVQYEAIVDAKDWDDAIAIADGYILEQWTLSDEQENDVVVDSAEEVSDTPS